MAAGLSLTDSLGGTDNNPGRHAAGVTGLRVKGNNSRKTAFQPFPALLESCELESGVHETVN